jgi:phthalate 4,5-dioxygenase oxygenase subunit
MDKNMSETLVRTGPGTAMGDLMRRYWVPVLLTSEIAEPDCPPVRVQILGEKLLACRCISVATKKMASAARITA